MDKSEVRNELLLKMYDQMFNDINRHILVVWQAIGVVIGAFAVFSLTDKELVPIDVAVALVVLLCGWMVAQLYDSAYWYNRNLVIIANIEKEFLTVEDLSHIHFYFGSHRKKNKMIGHLRIQRYLGVTISALVMLYHFQAARIWHGFSLPLSALNTYKTLPYLALLAAALFVNRVRNEREDAYAEFIKRSPGRNLAVPESNSAGHAMQRSWVHNLWLAVRLYRADDKGQPPAAADKGTDT